MDKKIVLFLDSLQRTIIGTFVSETDATYTVADTAILNAEPTKDGKLHVQIYPVFFKEFLKAKELNLNWTYSKNNITLSNDVEIEANLIKQYETMFKGREVAAVQAPTIKLFDADKK